MFCPNCGKHIPYGAAVCPMCGTRLPKVTPTQAQQQYGGVPGAQRQYVGVPSATPKKNAPLAVIVAVVVAVLAIFVLPGIFSGGNASEPTGSPSISSGGNSDSPSSSSGGNSDSPSSSSNAGSGTYGDLVGTWTGTVTSTVNCYASQVNVPVITINSIDDSGNVNFDAKINFHEHGLSKDNSTDGDVMLEFKGLTAKVKPYDNWNALTGVTTHGARFDYMFDVTKFADSARLNLTVDFLAAKTNRNMSVTIESYMPTGGAYYDTYAMSK